MQLAVGKKVFPEWASALTLVKAHGTSAVEFASAAVKAGDAPTRLDHAVRAMTSLDHVVDNARKLPVQWAVPQAPAYFRGYEAAKQAVTLLVASGLVPAAQERVGRQSLNAARDTFMAGVEAAAVDTTRFGRRLADGWLEATSEDARTGALMLRPDAETSRALLSGIEQVRAAVKAEKSIDPALVARVRSLFDSAGAELDAMIASAGPAAVGSAAGDAAFAESGRLLAEAAAAARGAAS